MSFKSKNNEYKKSLQSQMYDKTFIALSLYICNTYLTKICSCVKNIDTNEYATNFPTDQLP